MKKKNNIICLDLTHIICWVQSWFKMKKKKHYFVTKSSWFFWIYFFLVLFLFFNFCSVVDPWFLCSRLTPFQKQNKKPPQNNYKRLERTQYKQINHKKLRNKTIHTNELISNEITKKNQTNEKKNTHAIHEIRVM